MQINTYVERLQKIQAVRIQWPQDKVDCLTWLKEFGVKGRLTYSTDGLYGEPEVHLFLTYPKTVGMMSDTFKTTPIVEEIEREVYDNEWVVLDTFTQEISVFAATPSEFAHDWQQVEEPAKLEE